MILQREATACTRRVLRRRLALSRYVRCNDEQLRRRVTVRRQSTSPDGASTTLPSSNSLSNSPLLQELDENGVLTLTLNRPKQRNALNRQLLEMLQTSLTEAAATPLSSSDSFTDENQRPIRVVVIQSQGHVFSSGHDLRELMSFQDGDGDATEETSAEIRGLFQTCSLTMQLLQTIPQPTICVVNGLATAAGCQLVASCDMVIASPQASFQTPGVSIGLFCHTPAVPLVRCIGMKRAIDMLYTGRAITAEEALDFGLVSRVVENPYKEAAEIAKTMATERSSATLSMGKHVFYEQLIANDSEEAYSIASKAMEENMKLMDARIGIHSFLQKSKPTWRHQ